MSTIFGAFDPFSAKKMAPFLKIYVTIFFHDIPIGILSAQNQ
jgi:hypothetical protein